MTKLIPLASERQVKRLKYSNKNAIQSFQIFPGTFFLALMYYNISAPLMFLNLYTFLFLFERTGKSHLLNLAGHKGIKKQWSCCFF